MRHLHNLGIIALSVSTLGPVSDLESARETITQRIQASGAEVSVAFRTLDGDVELFIDAEETCHAASTYKVAIMVELFRQSQQGILCLDDPLLIKNEFASIIDGSPYQLSIEDDSDEVVYRHVGETMRLGDLCEAMITVSSNLATNLLIEKLGVENIRRTVSVLGADGLQVIRGVEDIKAFRAGRSNTTSARGLLILMERIAQGRALGPAEDGQMIEILKRQKFNEAIPRGLPAGTPVAHKTGQITEIHHDAGVVFAPRPFTLVVLVRGLADEESSAQLIADITRILYAASQKGE